MTGREYRRVDALPNLVASLKALSPIFPNSDSSISLPLGTPHVLVTPESGFNVPSVSRRLPDLQTLIPSPVPGSRCGCATRRLSINTPARGAPGNGAATARLTTDSLSLSTLADLTLNPIASVSRPGSLVFAAGPRLLTRARTSSPGPFLSADSGVVLEKKR